MTARTLAISGILGATAAPAGLASDCQFQVLSDLEWNTIRLGESVAICGNTLAVGVAADFDVPSRGAVYVFTRTSARWWRQAVVTRNQMESFGFFAAAIALHDETLIVGAPSTLNDPEIEGAVYVFERDSNGDWIQRAMLLGDAFDADPPLIESFGESLALQGDMLVVGAPWDDDNGYQSGSAYVFERHPDGTWVQTSKLLADDGYGGDHFGSSVSIHGDVIVVGAPDDDDLGFASGSAYVFERGAGGDWTQTIKLLPSDSGFLDQFGGAVAVQDRTLFVGADLAPDGDVAPGAVYIFERDPNQGWIEIQKLTPPEGQNSDLFGGSVALDGDMAIVTAENFDRSDEYPGHRAAFVYHRQPDRTWRLLWALPADDPQESFHFGRCVSLSGNIAVVGDPFHDTVDESGQPVENAGAAYVFAVGPDADGDGTMDVCECLAAGDLDLSGAIELQDLVFLLSSFGAGPGGDVDGDGQTDLSDLATLLAHFGETCMP